MSECRGPWTPWTEHVSWFWPEFLRFVKNGGRREVGGSWPRVPGICRRRCRPLFRRIWRPQEPSAPVHPSSVNTEARGQRGNCVDLPMELVIEEEHACVCTPMASQLPPPANAFARFAHFGPGGGGGRSGRRGFHLLLLGVFFSQSLLSSDSFSGFFCGW